MSWLKVLSLVLAGLAITGLTVGSVGFSAISATRDVSVSVAGNEEAYLGVDAAAAGNSGTTVTVENRFDRPVTVDRVVAGEEYTTDAPDVDTDLTLDAGDRASVTVDLDTEYVIVVVVGDGVEVRVTARVVA